MAASDKAPADEANAAYFTSLLAGIRAGEESWLAEDGKPVVELEELSFRKADLYRWENGKAMVDTNDPKAPAYEAVGKFVRRRAPQLEEKQGGTG